MTKKLIFIALLFCSTVLLGTRQPVALAAPFLYDDATATPVPEEEAVTAATPAPAEETEADATAAGEPTVADLLARLDALQTQVDELAEHQAADHQGADANEVATAVYLLDTAGLHDLDVRLNEEQVIDPSDAGRVARVSRLLASVDWPEPLATEIITLTTTLRDLTTALTDDDLESAAPLATLVHEVQHDFSHAAEHWLGETLGTHDDDADHAEEATHEEDADHAAEEGEGEGGEQKESSGG